MLKGRNTGKKYALRVIIILGRRKISVFGGIKNMDASQSLYKGVDVITVTLFFFMASFIKFFLKDLHSSQLHGPGAMLWIRILFCCVSLPSLLSSFLILVP